RSRTAPGRRRRSAQRARTAASPRTPFQGHCCALLAMTLKRLSFRSRGCAAPRNDGVGWRVPAAGSVRAGVVQPVAQQLAGLEERHVLFGDLDTVAGARVAADPRVAALDRAGAKAAQFDAVAACQGRGDLIDDRRDDALDMARIEVRACLAKPPAEVRVGRVAR